MFSVKDEGYEFEIYIIFNYIIFGYNIWPVLMLYFNVMIFS
jgi:hypothetical protein